MDGGVATTKLSITENRIFRSLKLRVFSNCNLVVAKPPIPTESNLTRRRKRDLAKPLQTTTSQVKKPHLINNSNRDLREQNKIPSSL